MHVNGPVSASDLDPKLAANFLVQLNIARRNVAAYPREHPLIAASTGQAALLLERLLAGRSAFTLGVAKDVLLVGDHSLEKSHPVFRDLAKVLFDHGIAAVTFASGLEGRELQGFSELLNAGREAIRDRGGIEAAATAAGFRHLRISAVRYDLFRVSEGESPAGADAPRSAAAAGGIWEHFVRGLLAGTLDPAGTLAGAPEQFDPEVLAAIVNERQAGTGGAGGKSYDGAIVSFLRQLDREQLTERYGSETLDKLAALVGRLTPELRRQFLRSSFAALADRGEVAEEVLARLPEEAILEALEEVNSRGATVPPAIAGLLQKLARHPLPPGRAVAAAPDAAEAGLTEKLRILFREEQGGEFVPERYQAALQTLIALDRIAVIEGEEAGQLKSTLLGHSVETQVANIIPELLPLARQPDQAAVLKRNLLDLCDYFLEMGDFAALTRIHERWSVAGEGEAGPRREMFAKIEEKYAGPEFTEAVLDGLALWGKPRYEEIKALIRQVGAPFTAPLLERLAVESSLTLRRYHVDCLEQLGEAARPAVLARLGDGRWYFVRNLVVILRRLDDPAILRHLRRFMEHPHPRVRQEVLRTFLHFDDPEADRLLLRDLAGSDRELQLGAVQLAEFSRSPEVFARLLETLAHGGIADFEFELKRAVVRTLAAIGNSEALPALAALLHGKSLLHPLQHGRLKGEIIGTLGGYPAAAAAPLLAEMARSPQQELARQAAVLLQTLQERTP